MNKPDLEKELVKVIKLYKDEKKNNEFLFREQKKFVKMAERAGSELAPYKAMVTRLEEEMEKLKSVLKNIGDIK